MRRLADEVTTARINATTAGATRNVPTSFGLPRSATPPWYAPGNGFQIFSFCSSTSTAFAQHATITTSTATSDVVCAARHVATKITTAARTVIRLSTLSCWFVDAATVTTVQQTIAAATMKAGRMPTVHV